MKWKKGQKKSFLFSCIYLFKYLYHSNDVIINDTLPLRHSFFLCLLYIVHIFTFGKEENRVYFRNEMK